MSLDVTPLNQCFILFQRDPAAFSRRRATTPLVTMTFVVYTSSSLVNTLTPSVVAGPKYNGTTSTVVPIPAGSSAFLTSTH